MKRLILSVLVCLAGLNTGVVEAQELKFGLKGGVNKTYGGQITGDDSGIPTSYTSDTFNAEGEIGYHGGIWAQVNFGKFFVRPEVMYSALESRFDFPQGPSIYAVDVVSVPLLLGYNIYGPLDLYAGPVYNKIMDSSIERLHEDEPQVVVQNSPLGAQVGLKAEFGSFGIDVRYDHTLATREPQTRMDFISNSRDFSVPTLNYADIDDARLNQIIVSLTLKLFDSANAGNRRRGGSCYF